MKISVIGNPVVFAPFSLEQVSALSKLSGMHYDATCKRAGAHGGFIYGWVNHLTYGGSEDGPVTIQATLRELDLVLKICECTLGLDPQEVGAVERLKKTVLAIISKVQKIASNWSVEATVEAPGDEKLMWAALEKVLPISECGEYMFMGTQHAAVNGQQVEVFLYKHGQFRTYLNLDAEGRSYRFTGSSYVLDSAAGA